MCQYIERLNFIVMMADLFTIYAYLRDEGWSRHINLTLVERLKRVGKLADLLSVDDDRELEYKIIREEEELRLQEHNFEDLG